MTPHSEPSGRRYDAERINGFVSEFERDGFCVLPGHFAKETLLGWRRKFDPLLERQIQVEGAASSRGPKRYYVTLPFEQPFAEPAIFEDPDILAITERLVGRDFVMCQLATDTPMRGSDFQEIHRDTFPLFPEWDRETPPFQLAINFPLVDVTTENGPLEIIRGTHRMSREQGLQLLKAGELRIEQSMLKLGDVMVRDVRTLHRGTPNQTDVPRPMCVIGYSRKWMFRPEVRIDVPKATWQALSPAARHMLRYNPIVDRLAEAPKVESYQTFSY